jgi:hypothetical protein
VSPWPQSSQDGLLDPFREQAALQMAAVVGGVLDEDLRERLRRPVQRLAADGVLIEVDGADLPAREVLVDRLWFPPAGRSPSFRSTSEQDLEFATTSRSSDSVKLRLLDTNTCSQDGRTERR